VFLATMNVALGVGTFTNVDQVVLGLELGATNVSAGDRLPATMLISNASPFELQYRWFTAAGWKDTTIGDFVITDVDGTRLPKTVPLYEVSHSGSGRTLHFRPGEAHRFEGDVVYGYSLTNPGIYFVRAIAMVPTTNAPAPDRLAGDRMVIETPPLAITVIPRPEGAPPPRPLYESLKPGIDVEMVMRVTAQERDSMPPLVVTQPTANRSALPSHTEGSVRPGSGIPKAGRKPLDNRGSVEHSSTVNSVLSSQRKLVYVIGLLMLGVGVGLFAWRSGRRRGPS
jgi:hypothetical protein